MLEWFAKHSARTNLHVYRDQLLSEYLPATHDYLATAVIGGKEFLGRGADVNETLALQAAFGELVERATLTSSDNQEIRITSNGIAAHSTFQKARDAAIAELVERDSFFTHYLTNTPFLPIDIPQDLADTAKILHQKGIELKLGKLIAPYGWEVVVATCFGENAEKPFGAFIGSSCRRDVNCAVRKAVKESTILVAGFLRQIEIFSDLRKTGPALHRELAIDLSMACQMKAFFNSDHFSQKLQPINIQRIQVQEIDKASAFKDCPVTVVRATSPDAQQLFFGETKPEHINFKRLSQFLGKEVRWEDVNKTTHVFA